jgi:hypothetical protein
MLPLRIVDKIEDPNVPFVTKTLRNDLWKNRINYMAKLTNSFLDSSWAAPILLSILLGYNIYDGQQKSQKINEQHDLLIELRTLNQVREKQELLDRQEKQRLAEMDTAWRENMKTQMKNLELTVVHATRNGNGNGRN